MCFHSPQALYCILSANSCDLFCVELGISNLGFFIFVTGLAMESSDSSWRVELRDVRYNK